MRCSHCASSLDEKKAQTVVDEIKAAGGDAIAVGGDVGADDFPERILKATIEYVYFSTSLPKRFPHRIASALFSKYGKLNHIVNNGELVSCILGCFSSSLFDT